MIRSYKEEQELKEKILELRKKNYPYDKIAMELGTNESRVKLIIGLLVEEGKLDSLATNLYKKETEEKLKQILSMAKAKRNVSEISSSLGISVDRTYLYLDRLVEKGRLSIAEVYQCADEEIEKRVIELRKAGLGQREIMKEMKITKQDTLRRILDKLFSEGKIDSYKKVDKTKKRIVELLKYGYNAEEISRQLVKDEQNIRSLMAELIRDGVITQDEITQAREAKKEKISFISEAHEKFYYEKLKEVRYQDVYHKALCYCLGISVDTRRNINSIYDFKTGCVKTECLHEGWQTSGSMKVVRMAFNLYCNSTPSVDDYKDAEEQVNECNRYTVEDLFCCAYAPFFWQAVQIRYPEYATYNRELYALFGGTD